jgi:hypothetical protein
VLVEPADTYAERDELIKLGDKWSQHVTPDQENSDGKIQMMNMKKKIIYKDYIKRWQNEFYHLLTGVRIRHLNCIPASLEIFFTRSRKIITRLLNLEHSPKTEKNRIRFYEYVDIWQY